jgi:chaperonin cofactor prefoldin
LNACVRQQQLCKNQLNKTEIVMQEVEKSKFKMYRSVGRMFVIADPAGLKKDLQVDLDKIKAEHDRSAEMQKNFEAKKIILTSQLNDLTPKAK